MQRFSVYCSDGSIRKTWAVTPEGAKERIRPDLRGEIEPLSASAVVTPEMAAQRLLGTDDKTLWRW